MVKKFAKFEEIFLVATLALMVVLIFGQVVGRYIFQSAPSWTEELARYLHIYQVWIGSSYAVKIREHIKIDAFINLFQGVTRKIIDSIALIIWFSLALFLAIFGTTLIIDTMNFGQVSPAIEIPMWIPMAALPLGTIGMSIRLVQQFILVWKNNTPKESEEITV